MCARVTLLSLEELQDVIGQIENQYGSPEDSLAEHWPVGEQYANGMAASQQRRSARAISDDLCFIRPEARPGSTVTALVPQKKVEIENGLSSTIDTVELIWGIQAFWLTKKQGQSKLVFNTRVESALGNSKLWKEPMLHGRCVFPVSSFFESHTSEVSIHPRTGKSEKRVYEFSSQSGEPLLLAGLSDSGRLSVVTTEPNDVVRAIHPRMPLILSFEEVPTWLGGSLDELGALADCSDVELHAKPEVQNRLDAPQLSLF